MVQLESKIQEWLEAHCINVTSVAVSYSEDTVTGTTTARWVVGVESDITEDLDAVAAPLLSGVANDPDLDLDTTYILELTQSGEGTVEYNFSSTSTISGALDWLEKVV